MPTTPLKRLFWMIGSALFAVGLAGWYDRLVYGHAHANYGSVVPWGLWVAVYIYFIGLSAGSFLISALVYVFNLKRFEPIGRLAVFTAVVTLFLALLAIWADLGHMDRAWHVLIYPNFKSPMTWMIWLYLAYILLLVAELWFLLRHDLIGGSATETRDRRIVRVLATIGVPLAILFHGGVGALFGVVAARPYWHSGLYPILFLLSALASGGALLTVIAAVFQDGWNRNREVVLALGKMVLGLLLLDVLFQASEMLVLLYGGATGAMDSLQLVIRGPFWWVFWVWQLAFGTLLPILLLTLPTRKDPRWVSLAGLLIAAGFLGVRLNIVIPGLAVEEIRGLAEAMASPRISTYYVPSLMEWLVTAGIVGLGLLMFGLGERLLPKERTEAGHVRV